MPNNQIIYTNNQLIYRTREITGNNVLNLDVMFCAALLELRNRRQQERLMKENEKNAAKSELVAETGEIVHGEGDATADDKEEELVDTAVVSEQNADGDVGEADRNESETSIERSAADVVETTPADVSSSQTNVADTVAPGGLDQLEQTEKLDVNEAEQLEPEVDGTTTSTAGQSVCVEPPSDTNGEVLHLADVKLDEVQEDDIEVIDLSDVTVHSASISNNQRVTVCFEVWLLQLPVLCTFVENILRGIYEWPCPHIFCPPVKYM